MMHFSIVLFSYLDRFLLIGKINDILENSVVVTVLLWYRKGTSNFYCFEFE